jgi:lipopolysaccharide transport system permease protein
LNESLSSPTHEVGRSRSELAEAPVAVPAPEPAPGDLSEDERIVYIAPPRGRARLQLGELWSYRELLYFLVWRDVKVRYKQAALGVAWVVVQPILAVTLFTILFSRLLKAPSQGVPYAPFVFAALLPWQLFAAALNQSANSLVVNRQLITKIYFARILLPVASVLAGLVDFGVGFLVLVALLFYYGIVPSAAVLLLPLFLLAALGTALAVGIWLAALNARYRDVQHLLPTLTQFWFFATPVAYSSTLLPESWRTLLGLNPMAGVAEGFRWALLGEKLTVGPLILVSLGFSAALLVGGIFYFRRTESTFADVV